MVKVLDFMGIEYKDFYLSKKKNIISRENLYKENTSVLSYYIIKCILMNNYQGFLSWCKTNNLSLLQFKKTNSNQMQYCKFIENNYRTKSMLENVRETEFYFYKNKYNKNNNNKNSQYILSNLRMSICELE
jgi:hypothetical protein